MLFATVLAFFILTVSPVKGHICERVTRNEPSGKDCPIIITGEPNKEMTSYSEYITVHVWMEFSDFSANPKIKISSPKKKSILNAKKSQHKGLCETPVKHDGRVPQDSLVRNITSGMWKLTYNVSQPQPSGSHLSVTYNTKSRKCKSNYTVLEPRPEFSVVVSKPNKTVTVFLDSEEKVNVRLCYEQLPHHCKDVLDQQPLEVTRSAVFNVSYLLPCLCVEVYYTYRDSKRHKNCPFINNDLIDVRDILRSYEAKLINSSVMWDSECPAKQLNISASLCWKHEENLCIPIHNSTLQEEEGPNLKFNAFGVDEHPQICVKFSLQHVYNVSCIFKDVRKPKSWATSIELSRRSILVHLTSTSTAVFSAQLCMLTDRGCAPVGPIHSVTTDSKEKNIFIPIDAPSMNTCVQVWQSDPALKGKRIMCPDYKRYRWGLMTVAVLIFLTVVTLFGLVIQHVIKRGAAGWITITKPVLLLCSSDESTHVFAASALASLLHGELGAKVHTALWAQNSQTRAESGAGVADVGPLPWLYGQWEAVCKAQGKILIVWSPEAKRTYEKLKMEKEERKNNEQNTDKYSKVCLNPKKVKVQVKEDLEINEKKCKEEDIFVELLDKKKRSSTREPPGVTEPVLMAALASLQECKGQGVSIIYFQGFCHNKDIPKSLRGAPRYCLPQDLSGLIQALGQVGRREKPAEQRLQCWSRLLSKALSIWLARQLARRLKTLLPQTQRKARQASTIRSTQKRALDRTQDELKSFQTAGSGSVLEQKLL